MAKVLAISDSSEPSLTVFIDTTLDTHLLMLLCPNDTVSDFKRKIEKEHMLCFSDVGEIVVHAIKVKRRGRYYYLSDSMLVKDAFGFVNKNWFLSVDASAKKREEERDDTLNLESNKRLTCYGVLANYSADDVCVPFDKTLKRWTSDSKREGEVSPEDVGCDNDAYRSDILEKHRVSVDAASQPDLAVKKRKRKTEQDVVNEENLREENTGFGKHTSTLAMMSQPKLGDKERSENEDLDNHLVANSDNRKTKRRKKLRDNLDLVTDELTVLGQGHVASSGVGQKDSDELNVASKGENGKKLCESGGISAKVGEQERSATDIQHKTDESEKETSAANRMEIAKNHLPLDVESNSSVVVKEPEDLQVDVEVFERTNIGSQQAERAEEQRVLSNKDDTRRVQSNDLDSPHQEETEAKGKDADNDANLVGENGSIMPEDSGKKRKRNKKTKGSIGKVLTTSGEPEVRVSDVNISAQPLGAKCGKDQPDEKGRDEEINLSPKDGNEVLKENMGSTLVAMEDALDEAKTIENNKKPETVAVPGKKKSRKKQKASAVNPPDVQVEAQDVMQINPTPSTLTTSKGVASSKTKKNKSTKAQHDEKGRDEEINLSPTDGNVLKETVGSTLVTKEDAVDEMKTNENNKKPDTVEEEPGKKKLKKKQKSSAVNPPEVQVEAQHVIRINPTPPILTKSEAVASSKTKKYKSNKDQPNEKSRDEEFNLSPTGGNEVLKESMGSTLVAKEDAVDEAKTIEKNEKPETVEEEPGKRKSRKKQKAPTVNLPDLQVEAQDVIQKSPTPPTLTKSEAVASSKTKKDMSTKDHLNVQKLKSDHLEVQKDSVPGKRKSVPAKSTKAQSQSLDHREKLSRDEPDVTSKPSKTTNLNETKTQTEVSEKGNKYSPDRAVNTPKARKNAKNPDSHSVQTSSSVQSSLQSNRKKVTPPGDSSARAVQQSALEEKSDESMTHPDKQMPKPITNALKASPADVSASSNSIRKEIGMQNGTGKIKNSGKNTDSPAVSSSELEIPKRTTSQSVASNKPQLGKVRHSAATVVKPPNKDNGANIKSLGVEKKPPSTPGGIFGNDSDESSDDEQMSDSDESTRTPSDHSSVHSDREDNDVDFESPQKGSHALDKTNGLNSHSPRGKTDLTLDVLLRSTSRYKKAKLTASQLQLEEEGQQVDFVPDSQANL